MSGILLEAVGVDVKDQLLIRSLALVRYSGITGNIMRQYVSYL
jgi:hypothetical protein